MSSRSRRRPETPERPDPAEAERRAEAAEAFEAAGTKQGLSRWVGLALEERKRQLEQPAASVRYHTEELLPQPEPRGLREPTPYERAVLFALGGKPMYGGTADPGVVEHRRRRNKAARKARRLNRLAAAR